MDFHKHLAPSSQGAAPFPQGFVLTVQDIGSAASPFAGERVTEVRIDARPVRLGWMGDIGEVITDLRSHWELVYYLTRRDIQIRYKQAVMGFGWSLLMPVMVVVSGLIVQLVLSHGGISKVAVAGTVVKSLPWAFFVGSIQFATNSLTSNMNLVSKIYFPREVLPLSAVLAQAFDASIGAVVIAAVLPFLGAHPGLAILWVPLILVLLFIFVVGAALFLSCANLFFRDVKYIVQVVLTFGIFFTPVLFQAQMLGPVGARIIMLNPIAPLLEGLRLAVVQGHDLTRGLTVVQNGRAVVEWAPWYLGYSAAWAVLGLAGALVMFRRLQYLYAEFI